MSNSVEDKIVVCLPVYNDWESALVLLEQIDQVCNRWHGEVDIVFVDDGSIDPSPDNIHIPLKSVSKVHLLQLRRNVGHQRAIVIGLAWIEHSNPASFVVVMDADGEDAPEDVQFLLEKCRKNSNSQIIFAQRRKRTESPLFRLGYLAFKWTHL